jgi:ubiquitin C-terminal hydrolase
MQGTNAAFDRPYSLEEFPHNMKVARKNYELMGIVAHCKRNVMNHYVAYTRRIGRIEWDLHDDILKKEVHNVSMKEQNVTPHLLFYVAPN